MDQIDETADFVELKPHVFNVVSILAYLDNPNVNYIFVNEQSGNLIPIYNDERRLLGYADVYVKGERLVAELAIDFATPERLNIENDDQPLFARIVGEYQVEPDLHSNDYPLIDIVGGDIKPTFNINISEIYVTSESPLDDRIDSLGKPVLL